MGRLIKVQRSLFVAAKTSDIHIRFTTLLYRYLFFDWLFADITKSRNLFERHSAWQHNRNMRHYLLTYIRRWSVFTVLAYGLGCLFEQTLETSMLAAWFFVCFCVALTRITIIFTIWVFLAKNETP